jgi:hypothetical protein
MNPNLDVAAQLAGIFQHVRAREKLTPYEQDLNGLFEILTTRMLSDLPHRRGQYFDGAVGLVATVRSPRKVVFEGEMWIGQNTEQWTEPFRFTITDKRITKQGLYLAVSVGCDKAEGDLASMFPILEGAEPVATDNPVAGQLFTGRFSESSRTQPGV